MQSFSTTSASPSKLLRLISFSSKPPQFLKTQIDHSSPLSSPSLARRSLLISTLFLPHPVASKAADVFYEIEGSGGVKVLELRVGGGASPTHGDKVVFYWVFRTDAIMIYEWISRLPKFVIELIRLLSITMDDLRQNKGGALTQHTITRTALEYQYPLFSPLGPRTM